MAQNQQLSSDVGRGKLAFELLVKTILAAFIIDIKLINRLWI